MTKSKENNLPMDIQSVYEDIRIKIQDARNKIYKYIDNNAVEVYWYIGKTVSELLNGNARAEYGKAVINTLSKN